jgi:hypothetical protein
MEIRNITYDVTIKGLTPLLMNKPSLLMSEVDPKKAKEGKGMNTKSPLEQAKDKLYELEGVLYQPETHLRGCLIEVGKNFSIKGKGKSTYSKVIGYSVEINPMEIEHKKKKWEVYSVLAVNPTTRGRNPIHRPMLRDWELDFTITFDESVIHPDVMKEMLDTAGRIVGIGDWRPNKKGRFGKFEVTRWEVQKTKTKK